MKLTKQAVEQFQLEGYLKITHRVLDDAHLASLREHYDAVFAQKRGTFGEGLRNIAAIGESADDPDADHSEEMLQIQQMWQRDEVFRDLLYHSTLLDIAESLIGPNYPGFLRSSPLQARESRRYRALASGQRLLGLRPSESG